MTPDQFAEWQEFAELEPFGAIARDRPLASLLSAIAASSGTVIDIDELLRAWGHYIPRPAFDADASERAICAGFGG